MSGANKFPNKIASIMPSGNAGLSTLIRITMIPIINPYTHLPVFVCDPETGSVAINTKPKA